MEENQEVIEQQEEVTEVQETVSKEEYDLLVTELEELKSKLPQEKSESELAIEAKEKELFKKEVNLTLKESGLEQFAEIIKVSDADELNTTVDVLKKIVNEIKVSTGYVPTEHAKQDAYNTAKSKGDTKGMIKSLFGLN
ncbi:hypothetical protein P4T04_03140 [Bacillus badius]|uniref:hypothetical protein n=1 Tax=Bacillus badius TaxID=1455 RepID=UPI002E22F902|nr:hypothetical protein [Bacillus badius]